MEQARERPALTGFRAATVAQGQKNKWNSFSSLDLPKSSTQVKTLISFSKMSKELNNQTDAPTHTYLPINPSFLCKFLAKVIQGSKGQRSELTGYCTGQLRCLWTLWKESQILRENEQFQILVDNYKWPHCLWLGLPSCHFFWGSFIPRLYIKGQDTLSKHTLHFLCRNSFFKALG